MEERKQNQEAVSKRINLLLYSITRDVERVEQYKSLKRKIQVLHNRACSAMRLDMQQECIEFRRQMIDLIEHARSVKESIDNKNYSV